MAYNPYVGTGYNPYQPSNQFTAIPSPQTMANTSLIWVQGEAGAKSYPVAPGNRVALFDSENPVVYVKEVDIYGKPLEIKIYDLVERTSVAEKVPKEPKIDLSNYITRDEMIDSIASAVSQEVEKAISEISLKPTSSKKKKEVDE